VDLRVIGVAISFIIVLVSGIWLTRAGRPYSGLLLNLHKLISLAGVVLLALVYCQASRAASLTPTEIAVAVATGVLLLASIVTGGLVSIDRPLAKAVLVAHRVLPFIALLGCGATVYLLLSPT
jgi:hypothetical protein